MNTSFTSKQREVLARKLGYDGPMQGFDEFLQSSPALMMKYNAVSDKFAQRMAKGGVVKYQEGGAVGTTRQVRERPFGRWLTVDDATGDIRDSSGNFYGNYKATPSLSKFAPTTTAAPSTMSIEDARSFVNERNQNTNTLAQKTTALPESQA